MRATIVLLAILLVTPAFAFDTAEAAPTVKLVAMGDMGATAATQANVNQAVARGFTTLLGLGDYYYWDPPSAWRNIAAPLLGDKPSLALGNHDEVSAIADLFPRGANFSRTFGDARVVFIDSNRDMSPTSAQFAWMRNELCNAPQSLRILASHAHWWLGAAAHHPGTNFLGSPSAMDDVVRDCGVDLVLASHEHNYQRMARNGVPYVIVGTGGASLYPVLGAASGTVASYSGYGALHLTITGSSYEAAFVTSDGFVADTFPTALPREVDIRFNAPGGNEWWVQVQIGGYDASRVVGADARVAGGTWVPLKNYGWGWATSVRVDAGKTVEYRARLNDGASVTSCAYLHPDAKCATVTPPPPPGTSVTFTESTGNEWWVQVKVGGPSAARVIRVDSQDTGGPWVALKNYGWGWAGSYRVEAGNLVTYRATLDDSTTVTSCAFSHPAGACATAPPSPPPSSFGATFSNARGNAWWVEVDVRVTGGTLSTADARVNDGTWKPITLRSWGSWAASMSAPAGSTVTFRATSTTGETATSSGFAWPPP